MRIIDNAKKLIERVKKTNIMRNVWTQIASMLISTGFATEIALYMGYVRRGDEETAVVCNAALISAVAVVCLIWAIWFLYVVWAKRHLVAMEPKGLNLLENISSIVFLYWMLCVVFGSLTGFWALPVLAAVLIWSLYEAWRYRRQLR